MEIVILCISEPKSCRYDIQYTCLYILESVKFHFHFHYLKLASENFIFCLTHIQMLCRFYFIKLKLEFT